MVSKHTHTHHTHTYTDGYLKNNWLDVTNIVVGIPISWQNEGRHPSNGPCVCFQSYLIMSGH